MGKGKLHKFAELATFSEVFERKTPHKGFWTKNYFGNNNPLILELACGQGDYARGMAAHFPNNNYIGVDIKGNRLWTASTLAQQAELKNIAFIREQIDHLEDYFAPEEVDEIWITFPDPFLKNSKHKKRLTSKKFIEVYRKFLKKDGLIHLKTDSEPLYNYTLEIIAELGLVILKNYEDVYALNKQEELYNIQTYYEKSHLADNRIIKYLCFKLQNS
jgi:tRNA (guanine-N7-)-methyltransferase